MGGEGDEQTEFQGVRGVMCSNGERGPAMSSASNQLMFHSKKGACLPPGNTHMHTQAGDGASLIDCKDLLGLKI